MTLVVRVGLGVGVELERREEESSRAEGRALCPSTLIDLVNSMSTEHLFS